MIVFVELSNSVHKVIRDNLKNRILSCIISETTMLLQKKFQPASETKQKCVENYD